MNAFLLIENATVERLGWVLLNSLWQIAIVAAIYGCIRQLTKSANWRYWSGIALLTIVAVLPVGTWWVLGNIESNGHDRAYVTLADLEHRPSTAESGPAATPSDFGDVVNPAHDFPLNKSEDSVSAEPARPEVAPGPGKQSNTDKALSTVAPVPSQVTSPTRSKRRPALQHLVALARPGLPYAVAAWLLGVLLFSLRPLSGSWTVFRLQRTGLSPVPTEIVNSATALSARMGLRRTIRILQSGLVHVPLVAGYLKPVILLPASAITNLTPYELESILRHELAHIKRHDAALNFLQTVLETVFFFHPAIWWLSGQIRNERENCCDDLASLNPAEARSLATALLRLEEIRPARHGVLAACDGDLKSRIGRLLSPASGEPRRQRRAGFVAAMTTIFMTLTTLTILVASSWFTPDPGRESSGNNIAEASSMANETPVEFETYEQIQQLDPATRRLQFVGGRYDLKGNWLTLIADRFPNLIELDLGESRSLESDDIESISRMTGLRALRITFGEKLDSGSCHYLTKLQELETLDVSYTERWCGDFAAARFATLPNLRTLVMMRHSANGCTGTSLEEFRRSPNLRNVFLTFQHAIAHHLPQRGERFRIHHVPDAPTRQFYSRVESKTAGLKAGVAVEASMHKYVVQDSSQFPVLDIRVSVEDINAFRDSGLDRIEFSHSPSAFALEIDGKIYETNVDFASRSSTMMDPFRQSIALNENEWLYDTGRQISGAALMSYLELTPGVHSLRVVFKGLGPDHLVSSGVINFEILPPVKKSNGEFGTDNFGDSDRSWEVAARLDRIRRDSVPRIVARLRNKTEQTDGTLNDRTLSARATPDSFQIEVNGKRFRYHGPDMYSWNQRLKPGDWMDTPIALGTDWIEAEVDAATATSENRLDLAPGKYQVKVWYTAPQGSDPVGSKPFELVVPQTRFAGEQRSGSSRLTSEEQIALNRQTWNAEKERLYAEHAGQWIAIVNGELSGPYQSIEDAAKECPDAEHRLIFRPGIDDGDVEFPLSPFIARSEENWIQFGYQLASDHQFTMSSWIWSSGGRELRLREDGRAGFKMLAPDGSAMINRHAVCSSLFRDQIAITENEVRELKLSGFRVPGIATYSKDHPGYKVFVKIQIPELEIDEYMLAYVLPDSLVKGVTYTIEPDDLREKLKIYIDESQNAQDAQDEELTIEESELDEQLKSLGSISNQPAFDARAYMDFADSVNQLKPERRELLLKRWCAEHNDQVIVLCRMLFQARDGSEFRRPYLGGPVFIDGQHIGNGRLLAGKSGEWPHEPVEIVDNVPFLIVTGYLLAGQAETASAYLDYCLKNCEWTRNDYSGSSDEIVRRAMEKLIEDRNLSEESQREFLSRQVPKEKPFRWTMFGKVVDDQGNPLPDVEVRMATGMATLLGGGSTTTDSEGNYEVEFTEGCWSQGPNTQVAWCFVSKSGYVYKSNSRNIDLSMFMSREPLDENHDPADYPWIQPEDLIVANRPHRLDIQMGKPAELLVRLFDEEGNRVPDSGIQLEDASQSSEVTGVDLTETEKTQTDFAIAVATDREWRLGVPGEGRHRFLASALNFTRPGRYQVDVTQTGEGISTALIINKVTRNDGEDVSETTIARDPLSSRPLPESLQKQAREVLSRVNATSKNWLQPGTNGAFANKPVRFQVKRGEEPEWIEGRNATALVPVHSTPLALIAAQPNKAIIRTLSISGDRIEIAYTLQDPYRVSIGNGIIGEYSGYVQTTVYDGVLVIDAETHTPIHHRFGKFRESFSGFVSLADGGAVPLDITFHSGVDFRWQFQVFGDAAWAMKSIKHSSSTISAVEADGKPLPLTHSPNP